MKAAISREPEKSYRTSRYQWAPAMGTEAAEWLVDGFRMMAEYAMTPEPTVQELTGRPGKTYREWAAANAEAFRPV
jgi:hypothetical protein